MFSHMFNVSLALHIPCFGSATLGAHSSNAIAAIRALHSMPAQERQAKLDSSAITTTTI